MGSDFELDDELLDIVGVSDLDNDEAMLKQYQQDFDADEIISHLLKGLNTENVGLKLMEVPINKIRISETLKVGRVATYTGLTSSITSLGNLTPVQVMTMYSDGNYQLLSGVRRLFSAVKLKETSVVALVYDFKDKDKARQVADLLGLVIGRGERHTTKEIWDMSLLVKEQSPKITNSVLEYLFQLQAGDYMKLQDCMQSTYIEDVVQPLINGELTIESAFKKLSNLRKGENRLAMEEAGEKGIIEEPEIIKPIEIMKDDDVLRILELGNDLRTDPTSLDEMSLADLDMAGSLTPAEKQSARNRRPVPNHIKFPTFERDGFECQCCGRGGDANRYVLDYHHKVPVSLGGEESKENGLTVCLCCHQLIHLYAAGDLSLTDVREEDVTTFKRIMYWGNLIILTIKKQGGNQADFKAKDNPHFKGRVPYWELASRAKQLDEYKEVKEVKE